MASTANRWECVEYILTQLRAHPMASGVKISEGWPGDEEKGELVYILTVDGEMSRPVMNAGRTVRDDKFQITIRFRILGKRDLNLTMRRLSEVFSALEDVLADNSTLGDLDGVVSAEITSPTPWSVGMSHEGPAGHAEATVEVHSRLTGPPADIDS